MAGSLRAAVDVVADDRASDVVDGVPGVLHASGLVTLALAHPVEARYLPQEGCCGASRFPASGVGSWCRLADRLIRRVA